VFMETLWHRSIGGPPLTDGGDIKEQEIPKYIEYLYPSSSAFFRFNISITSLHSATSRQCHTIVAHLSLNTQDAADHRRSLRHPAGRLYEAIR
jgi:hypothetical protein